MKLPAAHRAFVDPSKILDYLLSRSHRVGGSKAAFFSSIGYSIEDWRRLAADLRRHAREGEAVATKTTSYGQTYVVRGSLRCPGGRMVSLTAVWIVLGGENSPHS